MCIRDRRWAPHTQEILVNYINLPRAQREIVLRVWRTTLLYPLPKEVVTELIQLALSKHN